MNSTQYDIFISYKRKSLATANNLYYRLTTRGYSTFFDLEEMKRDNFDIQLLRYIENAKDVFVILEEGSLDACKYDTWEDDWFCKEIAYALEQNKNIIPILLGGYQMPDESTLPDKLKELTKKNAPEFSFSFFDSYLDRLIKQEYITSIAQTSNQFTSVFKFYSNENCQVFKEGKLVCSLEGRSDEPYYLPVERKGDYRFKIINVITGESQSKNAHIDSVEERDINIIWRKNIKIGWIARLATAFILLIITIIIFFWLYPNSPKFQENVVVPQGVKVYPVNANGVIFNLIKIDGGSFMMGCSKEDGGLADETPHRVVLDDYYIGQTEVTHALWNSVMGIIEKSSSKDNFPQVNISYDDCIRFIKELNTITGHNFSLPTEAEWEYAARGGIQSCGYKYSGSDILDNVAWYELNSNGSIQEVAQKAPNELGIYDMSGNVWEWCRDYYGEYDKNIEDNPEGIALGYRKVRRGGCWQDSDPCHRISFRSRLHPENSSKMGLRLVLEI